MNINREFLSRIFISALSVLMVFLITATSIISQVDISSLFFIPIAAVAWLLHNKKFTIVFFGLVVICFAVVVLGVARENFIQLAINVLQCGTTATMLFVGKGFYLKEKETARRDHLTGLLNSKGFNEKFIEEIQRFVRFSRPFSLIYLDVDNFKKVNDKFGHSVGDEVLSKIGGIIRQEVRVVDVPARMGGDEFIILLPETTEEQLRVVIEKLNCKLMEPFLEPKYPISFSCGGMTFHTLPMSSSEAIHLVDQLMYSVKHRHKNGYEIKSFR